MKKLGLYLLGGLLIALALFMAIYREDNEQEKDSGHESTGKSSDDPHDEKEEIVLLTDDQINKIGLTVQSASPKTLSLSLSNRGKITLDPDRIVHIIPKISGVAVEAMKNIGNQVRAGELIAVLESHEMADLKADYLSAASKVKLAETLLEREKSLYRKGVSSEQDYLNALHLHKEALISLQLNAHKLHAFGLNDEEINALESQPDSSLGLYEITSPIDGTLLMRHITKGEYIHQSSTIYEIADLSVVWVETSLNPKDLSKIKEGQIVEIINPEDQTSSQAKLIYVSPVISSESISAKAIAQLENPNGKWRPGAFVNMKIGTEEIVCPLAIPKEAIQKIEGADYAFVKTEAGFEKRAVKLGRCDNQNIEILSGLLPGESIAASHSFILKAELNKNSGEDEP